jgi:magnesium-transporting ATPase (P-type)
LRNPLDTAILESGPPRGAGWRKIDEAPFDFQRRRVSVLVESEGRRLLVTKGAPEDLIKCASRYEELGKPEPLPLDDSARIRATKLIDELCSNGFRILGVGWRKLEPDRASGPKPRDSRARARFWRIEENDEAGKKPSLAHRPPLPRYAESRSLPATTSM